MFFFFFEGIALTDKDGRIVNQKNRKSVSLIAYTGVLSILVPLLVLPCWSLAGRWPWPGLLPEGFTLRGMDELFCGTSRVFPVLASSVALSLSVAALATVIGTMTARAVVYYAFRGKSLVIFAAILPLIVPATAFAMGIHVVLIYMGLADTVFGVMLVHVIYALPYTVSIMTDVTAAVGPGPEIQGQVLGAAPFQAFWHITLPLIMPGVISSVSMAYIISFSQYFLTLMIGGGKVRTLSVIMVPFIQGGDRTIAASYAMLFVLSTLAVFLLLEVLFKKFTSRLTS